MLAALEEAGAHPGGPVGAEGVRIRSGPCHGLDQGAQAQGEVLDPPGTGCDGGALVSERLGIGPLESVHVLSPLVVTTNSP